MGEEGGRGGMGLGCRQRAWLGVYDRESGMFQGSDIVHTGTRVEGGWCREGNASVLPSYLCIMPACSCEQSGMLGSQFKPVTQTLHILFDPPLRLGVDARVQLLD